MAFVNNAPPAEAIASSCLGPPLRVQAKVTEATVPLSVTVAATCQGAGLVRTAKSGSCRITGGSGTDPASRGSDASWYSMRLLKPSLSLSAAATMPVSPK
ncbi:MAG: hypothetical protein BWY59_00145 [Verrucomicrobia bacterium ADurb.Bin345]|nr:MAG: hypothetical protein BWY59_00145 [Verrucomicrobia bacterium ADurb.Bin345]